MKLHCKIWVSVDMSRVGLQNSAGSGQAQLAQAYTVAGKCEGIYFCVNHQSYGN